MRQFGLGLMIVFSVILLLGALALGFLSSWNRADPNLHGMIAFLAGILALGIHIRGGSGFDLLAAVLLVIALALGIMTSGGGMSPEIHFWVAVFAVLTSTGIQIRSLLNGIKLGMASR